MNNLDKAKKIIEDLNDRSGVHIDFDDDIMDDIYDEIVQTIESYGI